MRVSLPPPDPDWAGVGLCWPMVAGTGCWEGWNRGILGEGGGGQVGRLGLGGGWDWPGRSRLDPNPPGCSDLH